MDAVCTANLVLLHVESTQLFPMRSKEATGFPSFLEMVRLQLSRGGSRM